MTGNPNNTATPEARALLAKAVESLISLLDLLEVDPELEDNGDAEAEPDDEPSLGSLDRAPQTRWSEGPPSYHFDHDQELDTADDEPSLGSLTSCGSNGSQGNWADGSSDDREKTGFATESDDEEDCLGWAANVDQSHLGLPLDEREPSLGWTEMEARYGRYGVDSNRDLEDDQVDGEASLGWQNEGQQGLLMMGTNDDREEQCEDEGAEHDGREEDGQSWVNPMAESRVGKRS